MAPALFPGELSEEGVRRVQKDQRRLHFEIQSQGASGLICTPFQSKQA